MSPRLKIFFIITDIILSAIISFVSFFTIAQAMKLKESEVTQVTPSDLIKKKTDVSGELPTVESEDNAPKDDILDDPNRINILLLGNGGANHPGGGLTDTIQVISLNISCKKVLMISVPRDLSIDVAGTGERKINEAYAVGERLGQGKGGQIAKETVARVVGLKINYFMRIDFSGFSRLVDVIGGIDVMVDEKLKDPIVRLNLEPGQYHMDGKEALAYVRSRKTTNDFDRARRQQKVIVAIKNRLLEDKILLEPNKINEIINILAKNLNFDIELTEIPRFTNLISGINVADIKNKVLDNNKTDNLLYSTYNRRGQYILLPVGGSWQKIRMKVRELLP